MTNTTKLKPEKRRYLVRIVLAMALYLGSLFAAEILIEDKGMTGWPAYLLTALPGLAFASVFWIFARLVVEERDEDKGRRRFDGVDDLQHCDHGHIGGK